LLSRVTLGTEDAPVRCRVRTQGEGQSQFTVRFSDYGSGQINKPCLGTIKERHPALEGHLDVDITLTRAGYVFDIYFRYCRTSAVVDSMLPPLDTIACALSIRTLGVVKKNKEGHYPVGLWVRRLPSRDEDRNVGGELG